MRVVDRRRIGSFAAFETGQVPNWGKPGGGIAFGGRFTVQIFASAEYKLGMSSHLDLVAYVSLVFWSHAWRE